MEDAEAEASSHRSHSQFTSKTIKIKQSQLPAYLLGGDAADATANLAILDTFPNKSDQKA